MKTSCSFCYTCLARLRGIEESADRKHCLTSFAHSSGYSAICFIQQTCALCSLCTSPSHCTLRNQWWTTHTWLTSVPGLTVWWERKALHIKQGSRTCRILRKLGSQEDKKRISDVGSLISYLVKCFFFFSLHLVCLKTSPTLQWHAKGLCMKKGWFKAMYLPWETYLLLGLASSENRNRKLTKQDKLY